MKYKIKVLNFISAKFDDSKENNEKYIVASTHNFIVVWTLKSILTNKIFDYEI